MSTQQEMEQELNERAKNGRGVRRAYKEYVDTYGSGYPMISIPGCDERTNKFLAPFVHMCYSASPKTGKGNNEADKKAYLEFMQKYLKVIGIELQPEQIAASYDRYVARLKEQEENILYDARELAGRGGREGVDDEGRKTAIEKIAEGADFVIVDGGPGAGKTYSLQNAAGDMDRPVLCLGSTPTAAKSLQEDMKETADKLGYEVLPNGGKTVTDVLNEWRGAKTPYDKEKVLEKYGIIPEKGLKAPCVMVDEAGLLNHGDIEAMMFIARKYNCKFIMAGDSQQIPNGNEQAFKLLVDRYRDNPAVYVNAPYINRSATFLENVITNGVYNECNRDFKSAVKAFGSAAAVEYLAAGIEAGRANPARNKEENFGFPKLDSFMSFLDKDWQKEDVEKFFKKDLKKAASAIKDEEDLGKVLRFDMTKEEYAKLSADEIKEKIAGLSKEEKMKYLAAVFVAQEMGLRAYDLLGKMDQEKGKGNGFKDKVAEDFKNVFPAAVEKDAKFADLPVLITATEEEADEMNRRVRKKLGKGDSLEVGEPIIVNGKKKIATEKDVQDALNGAYHPEYAYAMDVKATQGMSQKGKVLFMVSKDGLDKMQGGEILVGISRSKDKPGLQMYVEEGVDKKDLYKHSVDQRADYRYVSDTEEKGKAGFFAELRRKNIARKEEMLRKKIAVLERKSQYIYQTAKLGSKEDKNEAKKAYREAVKNIRKGRG